MQLARERELERQREVLELVYILRHLSDQEVRQAFLTGAAVATVRRRAPHCRAVDRTANTTAPASPLTLPPVPLGSRSMRST